MSYLSELKQILINSNTKNLIPIINLIIRFSKKTHFNMFPDNTNTVFDILENNIQYGDVDKFITFLILLRYASTNNDNKTEFSIALNFIATNTNLTQELKKKLIPGYPFTFVISPYAPNTSFLPINFASQYNLTLESNKKLAHDYLFNFVISPYAPNTSLLPLNFASQYNLLTVALILIELDLSYINAHDCTNIGNTALHIASKYGHLNMVKMLLQYNADVNRLNYNNETALHLASQYGHLDIVKVLLQYNADINISNNNNETALHFASQYGYLNIVKSLITENNTNMVLYNKNSPTPLFLARLNRHEEIVTYLYHSPYILTALDLFLAEKKDFKYIYLNYMFFKLFKNNNNKYSSFDFFIALLLLMRQEMILNNKAYQTFVLIKKFIEKNCFLKTKLLEKYPISSELINNPQAVFIRNKTLYPISSLHFAIQNNFLTIASILIELKMTDVNMLDPCEIFEDNTALHLASMYGYFDIVKSLCEHNANIYALNKNNKNPLNLAIETLLFDTNVVRYLISVYLLDAVEKNNFRQVQELITKTNDVNLRNQSQETLLHIASSKGYIEIAELLIENNANIEAHNCQEATPLHRASIYGHTKIVELLLNNKANIHAQTKGEQLTPLHFACIHRHLEIVDILIENQANIDQVDEDNKTPLHYAYENGCFPIIDLLIEKEADIQAKDIYGKIPLEYMKEETSFNFTHHLEQNRTTLCYKDNVSSKLTINNPLCFP